VSVTVALREPLEGRIAPGHEALLVRGEADAFALVGRWAGGGGLVGSRPVRRAAPTADPFAVLAGAGDPPRDAQEGFVGGGWFGYLGYAITEGPALRPRGLPPFALAYYDHVLRLDPEGRWWFEALWTPERDAVLRARRDEFAARLAAASSLQPGNTSTAEWRMTPSPAGHARAVAAARERIIHGDLYQANIATRLESTLTGEPVDLFARVVARLAPDRAAFLQGAWGAVASLSPELFLERHGDEVSSRPIKGTRRRGPGADDDARAELADSEKDRAENVMIVDLVRNDLGRIARYGTVHVPELASVEAHPGVWHLVSEVAATRRPETDDADLLRAAFPPGSVTGAPKIAAVEVIDELESSPRELFTGAVGFASPAAGLELSVVIRTFEMHDGRIWLDVGGGIVADSDPDAEAAEALNKARPLLESIGASRPSFVAGSAPQPLRLSTRAARRPDARGGLLETIKVVGGVPVFGELHLARLDASMRELYGTLLPTTIGREMAEAAVGAGRLRLLVDREGRVVLDPGPAVAAATAESIEPVTVPGGLGAHKWRDRGWIDALAEAVAPAHPLLVDLDGLVLEAGAAAVLAVIGGTLVAPPLDGRILPSVTRTVALRRARAAGVPVAIRPLLLDEMSAASEVILASALRGIRACGASGPVTAAIADGAAVPV
jgi:para-aminobenzoate synthetase/4-amino-4-deoxychorismate lyase